MAFGIVDYIVFGIMLMLSTFIGIYYRFTGGKQKTTQEYMLGNKNQGFLPVSFSLMASFMSAITLFGVSAEMYSYGTLFVVINVSYILGTPIIAYVFLPVFFKLGNLSVYEYLEKRFGRLTRTFTSLAFSVQMILYMSVVLYTPSIALEAVTGLSLISSITLVGLVCVFYSTIGGIKAVIITDVFQSLLMFASIYVVIGVAMYDTGGILEIWRIADKYGRIQFNNFNIDPTERHSWFSLVIGGMFTYVSLYAINQTQVQRYLTMKDYRTAVKSLWCSLPLLSLLSISTCFSGLAMFSKYYNCDPIKSGRISRADQLMPFYVLDTMGNIPGLTGLFVAGIFSSALSSVSPALNSLAAVTMEDYVKPLMKQDITDKKLVFFMKILVLIYGAICLLLAFLAQYFDSVLQTSLTIFGIIGGPVLAVFTLGVLLPHVNQKGSLIGLVIGLIFSFTLGLGGPKPPIKNLPTFTDGCSVLINKTIPNVEQGVKLFEGLQNDSNYLYLYRISYMYYIVLGFIVTFIVALIISAVFKESYCNNPDLFTPFVAKRLRKHGLLLKIKSTKMEQRTYVEDNNHLCS
ncbi:putative sodium-dependent multivitamin transporter [Sipha flava]|uniref:Sodium-dependent multivitamin transporter n=2 Tax=Sipha flava TaxID=143950 RepID=A0A2S2QY90_9HEMI|nr:putative sodium-dependent multivitamin transporter [Sipha flava]XP_025411165.1 putative sodium-dependent multivitamin transporter [Sipha flava]XP_025411166.1 putative sodium-dependent multivitamin transporter [Sipha flava]